MRWTRKQLRWPLLANFSRKLHHLARVRVFTMETWQTSDWIAKQITSCLVNDNSSSFSQFGWWLIVCLVKLGFKLRVVPQVLPLLCLLPFISHYRCWRYNEQHHNKIIHLLQPLFPLNSSSSEVKVSPTLPSILMSDLGLLPTALSPILGVIGPPNLFWCASVHKICLISV